MLDELKYACESVLFLLKLHAITTSCQKQPEELKKRRRGSIIFCKDKIQQTRLFWKALNQNIFTISQHGAIIQTGITRKKNPFLYVQLSVQTLYC